MRLLFIFLFQCALTGCAVLQEVPTAEIATLEVNGDKRNRQVLELYQLNNRGHKPDEFDFLTDIARHNCKNGNLFRLRAGDVDIANRQYLLLLTALQTGQTIDFHITNSCEGNRAIVSWVLLNDSSEALARFEPFEITPAFPSGNVPFRYSSSYANPRSVSADPHSPGGGISVNFPPFTDVSTRPVYHLRLRDTEGLFPLEVSCEIGGAQTFEIRLSYFAAGNIAGARTLAINHQGGGHPFIFTVPTPQVPETDEVQIRIFPQNIDPQRPWAVQGCKIS